MLYFLFANGLAEPMTGTLDNDFTPSDKSDTLRARLNAVGRESTGQPRYLCRLDLHNYDEAMALAAKANRWAEDQAAAKVPGSTPADPPPVRYIATDAGKHTSPRYDVIRVPQAGDKVSYGFNGDYYPDGKIVSVGTGIRMVVTTTGRGGKPGRYYRKGLTGSWRKEGGTWSLVMGHRSELNPEF